MADAVAPVDTRSEHPGRNSLVFGVLFTAAATLILGFLFWVMMDSLYGLVRALILGAVLFGMWAFMAHRVKVETREHLY